MRMTKSSRRMLSLVLVAGLGWGMALVAGCGPEGAGEAPKLKGSKDDIQKQMQPPLTTKAKKR